MNKTILSAVSLVLLLGLGACQRVSVPPDARANQRKRQPRGQLAVNPSGSYGSPKQIATLADANIDESSGLAASRTNAGVYWTHNDSGGGPFIYAFASNGERRGVWRVTGAPSGDWEDIAVGPGPQPNTNYLYIGDIGNNSGNRDGIIVYRFAEPQIQSTDSASSKKRPLATPPAEAFRLQYPAESPHDAEALLVHPNTGRIYIVTKAAFTDPEVFAADLPTDGPPMTMKSMGTLDTPGLFGGIITGGSISPDGRRVALVDYFQAYELVLPAGEDQFDQIWKQPMKSIDVGKRQQGEAICYRADGKALLVTSEGLPTPLIQVERK